MLRSELAHFLVAEDEAAVAAVYKRMLKRYGSVSVVASVREGLALVEARRFTGLIVDVALPDGSGIEIARAARARAWNARVLIVSGSVDSHRLDAAADVDALYLLKPVTLKQIERFAERAVKRERRGALLLAYWVERYGLTAAEEMTLRHAIDGLRRDEIATARRVSPITVRNQETALLRKLDAHSISLAVAAFYRALSR